MTTGVRKLTLAVHLVSSIGWLGAVVAYLTLDLVVANRDAQLVRGAWIGMGLITERAIVPFAVASLLTGIAMGAGTKWGLLRHWWVLVSLMLTLFAVAALLSETRVIAHGSALAADPATPVERLLELRSTLPHSIGGLIVLLVVQTLNIYKPQGLTPRGWRLQQARRVEAQRG